VVGSVYELPFEDGEFDMVLCMVVMEHLEDPKQAILEMKRVLKPHGKILVSVPFMFPMHDTPGDYWRFTKYGLKLLFKDWDILELSAETDMNETFAVLLQRVGYQATFSFNKIVKVFIFSLAGFIAWLPRFTKKIYGGIDRKTEEPEAFASSYFLVAQKK
jgi:ubiquinone/menaquinone biosynthesis C-methylase UbiE